MTHDHKGFWRDAFTFKESVGPRVILRSLIFGVFALILSLYNATSAPDIGVDLVPIGITGCVLGLLLVFRSSAGYDRWWEGRKLWGGIVNQSRALAVGALAYGPADRAWKERFVRRTIAYSYATRASLRGHKHVPELAGLLGDDEARRTEAEEHMPTYILLLLARQLDDACVRLGMDRFAYQAMDGHLSQLIDHLGGCERIARTHLPRINILLIRQFVTLFLLILPMGLMEQFHWLWPERFPFDVLSPLVTILVAYPILCVEQAGFELQDPFSADRLSHLPLGQITARNEADLLALLAADLLDGYDRSPLGAADQQGPAVGANPPAPETVGRAPQPLDADDRLAVLDPGPEADAQAAPL